MHQFRASTVEIAKSLGRRHNVIKRLCQKYSDEFIKLDGKEGDFKAQKVNHSTGGRPYEGILLNTKQILFLISLMRPGNQEVVSLKQKSIIGGELTSILNALDNFDFNNANKRYVYAAQDSVGNIKIGISNDPIKRVKQLSLGSAVKLKLIFTKSSNAIGYSEETKLHKQCEQYHIRSEWFTKDAIKELKCRIK